MAITNSFKKAVDDGDVKDIRIMMKESLLVDPSFADFNEKSSYAKNILGVYVDHDGRELNSDESTWDDNYINKLMSQLSTNFSRERVDHLKKVIRKLRPVAARLQTQTTNSYSSRSQRHETYGGSQRQQTRPPSNYQEQKYRDQRSGSYRDAKIAGGVVAGAVVGGAVAAVASATIIGGVAIGAVAGGVVAAIATNGEK